MGHPPRIPVWLGWEKPVIYFITICVADRKAVLAHLQENPVRAGLVSNSSDWPYQIGLNEDAF